MENYILWNQERENIFQKLIQSYEGNIKENWDRNKPFGIHTTDDYPELTNYDISY